MRRGALIAGCALALLSFAGCGSEGVVTPTPETVVGTVQQIVRVGHAGAQATWDGVVTSSPNAGGGDGD